MDNIIKVKAEVETAIAAAKAKKAELEKELAEIWNQETAAEKAAAAAIAAGDRAAHKKAAIELNYCSQRQAFLEAEVDRLENGAVIDPGTAAAWKRAIYDAQGRAEYDFNLECEKKIKELLTLAAAADQTIDAGNAVLWKICKELERAKSGPNKNLPGAPEIRIHANTLQIFQELARKPEGLRIKRYLKGI